MASSDFECPSCWKKVERDSAFCRYCGKPVSQAGGEAQAVIDRTADFSHPIEAFKAFDEYLERWPDSAQIIDVFIAQQCIRLLVILAGIQKGEFDGAFHDLGPLADAADARLPVCLSNGLVTSAQVADDAKRKIISDALSTARNVSASQLLALYSAAEKDAQSLLVDGKTQAQVKRISIEQAYRDAEVHYASYEKGELEAALRGFTYLKGLAPTDPYFRNMLGSILLKQNKYVLALQEFLYGLSLDPGDVNLTANTLRCTCELGLYPAAVEILRHHRAIGGDTQEPRLRTWGALAIAVTAALCMKLAKCTPEDFTPGATDLLEEFELPDRPWLTKPEKAGNVGDVLRDARIFISYRHAGGLDYAQRLERALKGARPSMHVFRDGTCLTPGMDFVDQIRDEIDAADVFLALIDRDFTGSGGRNVSRLLDRTDILRREVARAFQKSILVIPVLLEGAQMPRSNHVPEELRDFPQLHALSITEATFDRDFGFLLESMAHLVTAKQLREQAASKRFDEIFELDKRDPDAAKALIQPALDELPKFLGAKSVHGEGVPASSVEEAGLWECTATGPGGRMMLRFMTENTVGTPFSGEIRIVQGILGVPISESNEEIKGTWMPVYDFEKKLLLGILLDGIKAGEPFKLLIPFHRLLGRELVGTDEQGVSYSSRNVEPKRKGF